MHPFPLHASTDKTEIPLTVTKSPLSRKRRIAFHAKSLSVVLDGALFSRLYNINRLASLPHIPPPSLFTLSPSDLGYFHFLLQSVSIQLPCCLTLELMMSLIAELLPLSLFSHPDLNLMFRLELSI